MVEEFVLPKRGATGIRKGSARAEFERLDEVEEIARRRIAFDEKMKMIGHEAVGVDGEVTSCSGFAENLKRGITQVGVSEVATSLVAAESQEDGDLAEIVFGIEANRFASEH